MKLLLIPFGLFAGSYLLLRQIILSTGTRNQTKAMIVAAGLASWLFLLCAAGWILLALFLLYAFLVLGNIGAMAGLALMILLTGFGFKFNQVLDTAAVFYYLRDTALFRPMRPTVMIAQEELDKKEIRDAHRTTSDKPFPVLKPTKAVLTDGEIETLRRDLDNLKKQPKRSAHYAEELASLKSGMTTSISDGWRVYTFDQQLHEWYDEMSAVEIDPVARVLRFSLNIPKASEKALSSPRFQFIIKQDLYQLLQVLNSDPFLAGYNEYVDHFRATLFGIESDSFGHTQQFAFLRIVMDRSALRVREGKFTNAADLHKFSMLRFDNGKPLQDEIS